jgi:glycosyltransferase involved in cell wall biosynthesis
MSEKLTLCCPTQNRIGNMKRLIPKIIDYFDEVIVVDAFSIDGTKEWLESYSPKIKVVQRQWDDSFARQYNRFIQEVKEGWFVVCDDDELPSEDMLKSLRKIIEDSNEGKRYDIVEFKCNPIEIDNRGVIVNDNGPVDYYRTLLHRYNPGMKYVIDLHQNLIGHKYKRFCRRNETYYHIKSDEDSYRNACRNWWIDGIWLSGSSSGIRPKEWYELRDTVQKAYPKVKVFSDFNAIMVKGNMDKGVKDYLTRVKDIPDEPPERLMNELRAYWKYYFEKLHPEEREDNE